MGFWDVMLGGLNAGSAPKAEYQHAGQIQGLINGGINASQTRAAPQLNGMPQQQMRDGQMTQIGQLQGIASGQQQGAGELAAQRQASNAAAQQQAMARMTRGGNAALANRNAARNVAGIGLAAAGMGQQAAMQDQQGAQALLSQALGQGRGQDLTLAGQNAGLQSQTNGQNDQLYMGLLSQLTGMDANLLAAKMAEWQANKQQTGLLPGLMQAGAQIGAAAV